jgi:hypothetical protein
MSSEDNYASSTEKDVIRAVARRSMSVYVSHRSNTHLISTQLDTELFYLLL